MKDLFDVESTMRLPDAHTAGIHPLKKAKNRLASASSCCIAGEIELGQARDLHALQQR